MTKDADLAPLTKALEDQIDFFIDKHQLAQMIGCKSRSLYLMERKGIIPRRFKLGRGRVRWSLREVLEWQKGVKAARVELAPLIEYYRPKKRGPAPKQTGTPIAQSQRVPRALRVPHGLG